MQQSNLNFNSTVKAMNIPYDQLSPDTLKAVIEEFITRNGTDYGEEEATMEEKIEQAMEQLKEGKAFIVYDDESKTCNIVGQGIKRKCSS